MGRQCTVCSHKDVEKINKRLARNEVFRTIADDTGLSETALKRHKAEHIPDALTKAEDIKDVAEANTLLEDIKSLRERATGILDRAERSGDLKTALLGIREARGCLELLAKVEGQINDRPQTQINILINPQWVELRTLILTALEPYPQAREAVVNALHV
jgi:hypothetical protein